MQSPDKWSETGKELMNQFYRKYDEIKTAYELSQEFKNWYDIRNKSKGRSVIEEELYHWHTKTKLVETNEFTEFKSFVKMIRKHEYEILNYFKHGHTNAKAERLNGKIQRFISDNYGFRDKDFALFRLVKYFS
jgi:transposase